VALRPRLSPGVPLSWMRIVLLTLWSGTAVVKNNGLQTLRGHRSGNPWLDEGEGLGGDPHQL
jgi:hypothetical protein